MTGRNCRLVCLTLYRGLVPVPVSGTTARRSSSAVSVVFDTTGLTGGTHTGSLCINTNDATHSKMMVPVTLTVTPLYTLTLVYHDLEDVVQAGDQVYVAGTFNGWNTNATALTSDAGNTTFTATLNVPAGSSSYKYVVKSGGDQWDWLNTSDRVYVVSGEATVDDYRNVKVGYAHLIGPATLNAFTGQATAPITSEVYIQNVTNPAGLGRGVKAETGFGLPATAISGWQWSGRSYFGQNGNNDVLTASITPLATGVYSYAVRFDGNWGAGNPNAGWTYGDLNGVSPSDPFELNQTGVLTVQQPPASLQVHIVGNGTVSQNPLPPYVVGDVVTLTANADTNWAFAGWSGDLSGTTNPITITLTGDKVVTATFVSTCVPVNGVDFTYLPTAPKVNKIVTFDGTA